MTSLVALLLMPPAHAATLAVPGTYKTVGGAMLFASNGDVIEVDGAYHATGETSVTVSVDVTVAGVNGRPSLPAFYDLGHQLTIRDADVVGTYTDSSGTTYQIEQIGGALRLSDVTLVPSGNTVGIGISLALLEARELKADDFAGAPVISAALADLRIDTAWFYDDHRGAIQINASRLAIADATFDGTTSYTDDPDATATPTNGPYGGAILSLASDVFVADSTFSYDGADSAGAIGTVDGTLTLLRCAFEGDRSLTVGGAIGSSQGDSNGDGVPDGPGTEVWITDSTFHDVGAGAGGAIAAQGGSVHLDGTTFEEVAATGTSLWSDPAEMVGGAVFVDDSHLEVLDVTIDGASAMGGGAIASLDGEVSLRGLVVRDATATYGGALAIGSPTTFELSRSMICGGQATEGAALLLDRANVGAMTVSNTRFVANSGEGSTVAVIDDDSDVGALADRIDFNHVTFAANETPNGALHAYAGPTVLHDSIVAGTPIGVQVEKRAVFYADDTLWWDVPEHVRGGEEGEVAIEADPMFADYAIDCDATLWLRSGSPARDVDANETDPDGTAADLGAWGGPDADLEDSDGDGVFEDLDCDDQDPRVHPGAPEVFYDGLDEGCDGGDDFDADGDGHDLAEAGGDDCDDQDAGVNPDAEDVPGDWIDQDCNGSDTIAYTRGGGGCGCASGAATSSPVSLLGLLAVLGRRRRRPGDR